MEDGWNEKNIKNLNGEKRFDQGDVSIIIIIIIQITVDICHIMNIEIGSRRGDLSFWLQY